MGNKKNIFSINKNKDKVKKKLTTKKELNKVISKKFGPKEIKFKKLTKTKKGLLKKKLISKMSYDKGTSKIFMDMFSRLSKNNIEIHYVNGTIVYKTKK
jgi:hypothetical protein